METTYRIYTIHDKRGLWCSCSALPGVYGFYDNQSLAEQDLRNQIIQELKFEDFVKDKPVDRSSDVIKIEFFYGEE